MMTTWTELKCLVGENLAMFFLNKILNPSPSLAYVGYSLTTHYIVLIL
jgi:hypothetical protein